MCALASRHVRLAISAVRPLRTRSETRWGAKRAQLYHYFKYIQLMK